MAIRIALFALPTALVVGVVLLLNDLDAGAGIAAATLGLVAVAGGATLGYFANRLPVLRDRQRGSCGSSSSISSAVPSKS